jgi:small subunit ribosomal protein S6
MDSGLKTKRGICMNFYETLFIIKPTLTKEEIESQIERVEKIISKSKGIVKIINRMGVRKLAYHIDKQGRGYYAVVYHSSPANLIKELEYQLRYNEEILRFMTVRYTTKKEIAEFERVVKANSKENKEKEDRKEDKKDSKDLKDKSPDKETAQNVEKS